MRTSIIALTITLALAPALPSAVAAAPGLAPAFVAPMPGSAKHGRPAWVPQVQAPVRHWAREEKQRRVGPALYASSLLALAAGSFALWSKHEADEAYERYLKQASRDRQQSQLSRAKRFDRITGAAYAAMEVGVLLTAYYVFF